MSDELDIRSGGAVHVDTASLRAARDTASALAERVREARRGLQHAARCVAGLTSAEGRSALWGADATLARGALAAEHLAGRLEGLARDLGAAADLYEIVELEARLMLATAAGNAIERAAIEERVLALGRDRWGWAGGVSPVLTFGLARAAREPESAGGLAAQAHLGGWLLGGPMGAASAGASVALLSGAAWLLNAGHRSARPGTPRIPSASSPGGPAPAGPPPILGRSPALGPPPPIAGAPAAPTGPPPVVSPVRARAEVRAPAGLAGAAARIPGGADSRVRVERYDMPDGSREWAVYITGTQEFGAIVPRSAGDPFDMASNLQLYAGQGSASYDAVVEAMRQSGVAPGEPVHALAHSQGALIGQALATAGEFDVRTVVAFGSPTPSTVASNVLSVDVRHTDDIVAALAGPPRAEPIGAPGSMVVQRLADPLPGPHDLGIPAHHMQAYIETAGLIDASPDPRAARLSELWSELGTAERVTSTEYSARRQGSFSPRAGAAG
ncbi:hypothetical protein AB2L57_17070 [Microbacterium sp. HA-8]|uniref:hypothetical protein n=1 Tax=Microbacterium sp. HA-8 TaxID=3234200 RepID=UPI0038F7CBF6